MKQNIQRILRTINRLDSEIEKVYKEISAHFDLSETELWVLYELCHSEKPCTQNDLCKDWFYPAQTIHYAVNTMQKKGYVELETIPGTKNRKKILLTEEGKQLAAHTIGKVDEIEKSAILKFTEAEREAYVALYKRYLKNLKREKLRVLGDSSKRG
ncbi:MAG: helix-turn-helix domain-containing protein [Planctomycetia bacterium]|nr:helix-turn-helix domain-containing protein [Planctomycetia bacterium]